MDLSKSLASLKEIDLNDLDLKNAGSWPPVVKGIACFIIAILVIVAGYHFLLKDMEVVLANKEQEEVRLKQDFEKKAHKASNLPAYKLQLIELEENFSTLLRQLPRETEVPDLLEDITHTGLGAGLAFESFGLQPEVTREFYKELPISMKVTGSYHELATFISGISALPRIVTVHDLSVSPRNKDQSLLGMTVQVKTYRYQDVAEGEVK